MRLKAGLLASIAVIGIGCATPAVDRGTSAAAPNCEHSTCWMGGEGDATTAIAVTVGVSVATILGIVIYDYVDARQ